MSPAEASIQGTVNKAALLLCAAITAAWTWNLYYHSPDPTAITPWVALEAIAGFIVALVTVFKKTWAPVTTPIYALLEGLVLGGVSALAEAQFPGIAIQAVTLTFGTFFALLVAYKSGLIRASEKLITIPFFFAPSCYRIEHG